MGETEGTEVEESGLKSKGRVATPGHRISMPLRSQSRNTSSLLETDSRCKGISMENLNGRQSLNESETIAPKTPRY